MHRRLLILVACLAVGTSGATLGACGGDDDSGSGGGGGAATTEAPAGKAASGDTVAISMKDIAFAPATATAKVGQRITWTNDDTVDHNVVAEQGADFKSDNFGQGGTFDFTPEQAGTISYVCTIHPGMDGTIQVGE